MMHERPNADQERQRELTVYQYVLAFDRGDLDTIEEIVRQAESDPELDRQLASVNAALHAEAGLQPLKEQAQTVRRLLLRHMPTAMAEEEPPLTVGEVAARVRSDPPTGRTLSLADRLANEQLIGSKVLVPDQATTAMIAKLARDLGLDASARYWELFRRAAVVLGISRQHEQVQLAAARRAAGRRPAKEGASEDPRGQKEGGDVRSG
jgi:hypothetical protein